MSHNAVLPLPVKAVEKYLPHRPPMVWVDDVLQFSEKAGVCRVRLKIDAHYMDAEQRLRPTSCLEFIAQAYGFISVCHHIYILDPNSKPLSKAFLASIKNAKLPSLEILSQLRAGDDLTISVTGVRQMGPIVLFLGNVSRGDLVVCEAEMKVFKEYEV